MNTFLSLILLYLPRYFFTHDSILSPIFLIEKAYKKANCISTHQKSFTFCSVCRSLVFSSCVYVWWNNFSHRMNMFFRALLIFPYLSNSTKTRISTILYDRTSSNNWSIWFWMLCDWTSQSHRVSTSLGWWVVRWMNWRYWVEYSLKTYHSSSKTIFW